MDVNSEDEYKVNCAKNRDNGFSIEMKADYIPKHECHRLHTINKLKFLIEEYEIKMLNPSRPGKKLLVLDLDRTLWDSSCYLPTSATTELMRPYLHEFLTSAYEDYDIVVWSATSMSYIKDKLNLLGVSMHENYKIMFYLDRLAMLSKMKPLAMIWGKFQQYTNKNTIMLDDIDENFALNPKNGLKVTPFRNNHTNHTDNQLLLLSKYLKDLTLYCDDFSTVKHNCWKSYSPMRVND